MVRTVVRRSCDPVVVQKIWNMVEYSRVNKQATTLDRVTRAVMKELSASENEAVKHIDNALADGLLERYSWTVAKGNRAGETMEGLRIPEFKEPIDKRFEHDWYCFRCHKPGEVLECTECFRVWHPACLPGKTAPPEGVFLCPTCVMNSKAEYKRKQIRKLLEFATHRLKGKPLWKDLGRIGYLDDQGRNDYLLFKYLDLNVISKKIKDARYRSLESFLVDVNTLLHDVCVMYGDLSNMADLARVLLREIEVEIYEIRLCTNCYINAKARPSEWISKPCRPAHELVWAKLKGFPFWPAKVLEEKDTTYEVRFFGSYHERAAVTKESTRPYDIPPEELGVRRTPAFQRALNEVQKLQRLVGEGYYTSSSGDSDMPPSDDDWSDELYILASTGGGAGSSSARKRRTSSAAAADASSSSAKKAALMTSSGSTSKKKKFKKKSSASFSKKHRRSGGDSSSEDEADNDDIDDDVDDVSTMKKLDVDVDDRMSDADSESSDSGDDWRVRVGLSPAGSGKSGGKNTGAKQTRKKPPPPTTSTVVSSAKKSTTPAMSSNRRSAAAPTSSSSTSSSKLRRGGAATVATGGVGAAIMASPPAAAAAASGASTGASAGSRSRPQSAAAGASVSAAAAAAAAAASGKQTKQQQKKKPAKKQQEQQRQRKRSDLSSTDSSASSSPGSTCAVTSSIVEPRQQQQQHLSHHAQQHHHQQHQQAQSLPHHGVGGVGAAAGSAAAAAVVGSGNLRTPSPVKMVHKSVQVSTLDANVFEEALAAERKKLEEAVAAARMQAEAQTKAELDKSEADLRGEFQRELENIMHQHREAIANTKRRQWCYNCLEEAMYHCCWNTSYCSIKCQQDHWHKEHKRVCRRKR